MSADFNMDCSKLIPESATKDMSKLEKAVQLLKDVGHSLTSDVSQIIAIEIQLILDVVVKKIVLNMIEKMALSFAARTAAKAVAMGISAVNVVGLAGMAVDAFDAFIGDKFTLFATKEGMDAAFLDMLNTLKENFTPEFKQCLVNTIKKVYVKANLTVPSDESILRKVQAEIATYRVTNDIPTPFNYFKNQMYSSCDLEKDDCVPDCLPEQTDTDTELKKPGTLCPSDWKQWWDEYINNDCNIKDAEEQAAKAYPSSSTERYQPNPRPKMQPYVILFVLLGMSVSAYYFTQKNTKLGIICSLLTIVVVSCYLLHTPKEGFLQTECPAKQPVDKDSCKIYSYAADHPEWCTKTFCDKLNTKYPKIQECDAYYASLNRPAGTKPFIDPQAVQDCLKDFKWFGKMDECLKSKGYDPTVATQSKSLPPGIPADPKVCNQYFNMKCKYLTAGRNRSVLTDQELKDLTKRFDGNVSLRVDIYSPIQPSQDPYKRTQLGTELIKVKDMYDFVTTSTKYPDNAVMQIGFIPVDTAACDTLKAKYNIETEMDLCKLNRSPPQGTNQLGELESWQLAMCTPTFRSEILKDCPKPPLQDGQVDCAELARRYNVTDWNSAAEMGGVWKLKDCNNVLGFYPPAAYNVGKWSKCDPATNTRTRSVVCTDLRDKTPVDDSRCKETKPTTSESCIPTYEDWDCKGPYDSHPRCEDLIQIYMRSSPGLSRCEAQRQVALQTNNTDCSPITTVYPEPLLADPCSVYLDGDTNISQRCFDSLWKNEGCTTSALPVDASKTLRELKAMTSNYANICGSSYRQGCYGMDRTKYPECKAPTSDSSIKYPYDFASIGVWNKLDGRLENQYKIDMGYPTAISGLDYKGQSSLTPSSYAAVEKVNNGSIYDIRINPLTSKAEECKRLSESVNWSNASAQDKYSWLALRCDLPADIPAACTSEQTRADDGSCVWKPCSNAEQTRSSDGACEWKPCLYPEQTRNQQGVCQWPSVQCLSPLQFRTTLSSGQPVCQDCPEGQQGNNADLNKINTINPTENTFCVAKPPPVELLCQPGQYINPGNGQCMWPDSYCKNLYEAPVVLPNGAKICGLCPPGEEGNNAPAMRSGGRGWSNTKCAPSTYFADKCIGSDCSVEGQICLPGTEGSSGKAWVCQNQKWVNSPTTVANIFNVNQPYVGSNIVKKWPGPQPTSCPAYDNELISQDCYNQLYAQLGCQGTVPAMTAYEQVLPKGAIFNKLRQQCSV